MSFRTEFDPKALKEYLEAWDWYEEQQDGLGDRFGFAVNEQIGKIAVNPLFYPNKKLKTRESKVRKFPFLIVYRIFPEKNTLYIVSIFHTSRSPRKKYQP